MYSVLVIMGILIVTVFLPVKDHGLIVDENEIHYSIQNLVQNGLDLKASMSDKSHPYTTLPTFNFLIACIAKLANNAALPALRGYSMVLSLLCIAAFFITARKIEK